MPAKCYSSDHVARLHFSARVASMVPPMAAQPDAVGPNIGWIWAGQVGSEGSEWAREVMEAMDAIEVSEGNGRSEVID